MLLGAGNYLRLYQIDDIFFRERPIWQDESDGDDSWRYGQVSISGVTQHQVKTALWILLGVLSNTRWHGDEDPPCTPDSKLFSEIYKPISFQALLVRIAAWWDCHILLQSMMEGFVPCVWSFVADDWFSIIVEDWAIGNEYVFIHLIHWIAHVYTKYQTSFEVDRSHSWSGWETTSALLGIFKSLRILNVTHDIISFTSIYYYCFSWFLKET